MSFENSDLYVVFLAISGTSSPAHVFKNNDIKQIYDAIIAANALKPTATSYTDIESSGTTTSTTGLSFGSTYSFNIPAGKKAFILSTGGIVVGQSAGVKMLTYTGFYFTFSGGFLPDGFYFGDINGQTPTKIKVGGSYVYTENISPAGAQTNLSTHNALSAEIINTTGSTLSITLKKAVKTSGAYSAAWNSSAGNENYINILIL